MESIKVSLMFCCESEGTKAKGQPAGTVVGRACEHVVSPAKTRPTMHDRRQPHRESLWRFLKQIHFGDLVAEEESTRSGNATLVEPARPRASLLGVASSSLATTSASYTNTFTASSKLLRPRSQLSATTWSSTLVTTCGAGETATRPTRLRAPPAG